MPKTMFLVLVALAGCTNTPVDLQQRCPCAPEIQQAYETLTEQDNDLSCRTDDNAYGLMNLRFTVDVQRRRIEALEDAVLSLRCDGEGGGAP